MVAQECCTGLKDFQFLQTFCSSRQIQNTRTFIDDGHIRIHSSEKDLKNLLRFDLGSIPQYGHDCERGYLDKGPICRSLINAITKKYNQM